LRALLRIGGGRHRRRRGIPRWGPYAATLGAIDYGVELVSTNGADATFAVTGFSLTAN
jgi:hypothetical protein